MEVWMQNTSFRNSEDHIGKLFQAFFFTFVTPSIPISYIYSANNSYLVVVFRKFHLHFCRR